MPLTTIVDTDTGATLTEETYVADMASPPFSWSAVVAGALVATAVTFFLVTLGSGVGLSLVSAHTATPATAVTFLTLGAIYFLAAQAFGFGVGGHVAGRLIGPALETQKEEDFRSGVHGLVMWALAVVATVALLALSALTAGTAAGNSALVAVAAHSNSGLDAALPAATRYWVDTLFRPAQEMRASLAGRQYAQADTNTGSDASPAPESSPPNDAAAPATDEPSQPSDQPSGNSGNLPSGEFINKSGPSTGPTLVPGAQIPPNAQNIPADKTEVGHILAIGMADGGWLSRDDRNQVIRLVSQDVGLTPGTAAQRVNDMEKRVHADEAQAAETAREITKYASLWTALALLFGAVVAAMAAVSARWEDDRVRLGG